MSQFKIGDGVVLRTGRNLQHLCSPEVTYCVTDILPKGNSINEQTELIVLYDDKGNRRTLHPEHLVLAKIPDRSLLEDTFTPEELETARSIMEK